MVRINADVDQGEYDALLRLRGKGTWRELILTTLNISHEARDRGPPRKHALDSIYIDQNPKQTSTSLDDVSPSAVDRDKQRVRVHGKG